MKKRYDYHSVLNIRQLLFVFCFVIVGMSTIILFIDPTLFGKLFTLFLTTACIAMSFLAYLDRIKTYIEVTEDGILFHGWRKQIYSPWPQLREIRKVTPTLKAFFAPYPYFKYKIFTAKGSFVIYPSLEPADEEVRTIYNDERRNAKYQNELISDILNRTQGVKISLAVLMRPIGSPTVDRALKALAVILLVTLCFLIAYSIWDDFIQ